MFLLYFIKNTTNNQSEWLKESVWVYMFCYQQQQLGRQTDAVVEQLHPELVSSPPRTLAPFHHSISDLTGAPRNQRRQIATSHLSTDSDLDSSIWTAVSRFWCTVIQHVTMTAAEWTKKNRTIEDPIWEGNPRQMYFSLTLHAWSNTYIWVPTGFSALLHRC